MNGEMVMNWQMQGKTVVALYPYRQKPALGTRINNALVVAFDTLLSWRERARSRRLLLSLDDHMLQDVGLDPGSATQEATTPFWRGAGLRPTRRACRRAPALPRNHA